MEKMRTDHTRIVAKAKAAAGVEELMKVYQRFQKANAATTKYMQLVSPGTYQLNSNKSLLG